MKPWNVKPGMLIKVGAIYGPDWRVVVSVIKQSCWLGPGYMYKMYFKEFARIESIIRFKEDSVEVKRVKGKEVYETP